LTTKLITSRFADETLFFKHNSAEEDTTDEPRKDWPNYKDSVSFGLIEGVDVKRAEVTAYIACPVKKILRKLLKLFF